MDCSITPTRHDGLDFISTTDFFYPLVEDPYEQGWIGAANVLSDLFAMGVTHCDTMLMLIAASTKMERPLQMRVTELVMRGFADAAVAAGTRVSGGQTVVNPWPIIGGVASAICKRSEYVAPDGAQAPGVIVLTKPLGTQISVNLHQWLLQAERHGDKSPSHHYWTRLVKAGEAGEAFRDPSYIKSSYEAASGCMRRLNREASRLMIAHGALAATDVTGFGLLGHAENLAAAAQVPVRFRIHTLPCLAGTVAADEALGKMFQLRAGRSAETSGGLLIVFPSEKQASEYIGALAEADHSLPAWIIGTVEESPSAAEAGEVIMEPDAQVVEVQTEQVLTPSFVQYTSAIRERALDDMLAKRQQADEQVR